MRLPARCQLGLPSSGGWTGVGGSTWSVVASVPHGYKQEAAVVHHMNFSTGLLEGL